MLLQQVNRYWSSSHSWKICVGIHLSCQQRNPHMDNFFNLVLFSLFSRSSPDNLSLCPHCNSRFLFIKEIVVHIKCYAISSVLTWKKDKQMSHNATSVRDNCAVCHVLCFVPLGKRIEKICQSYVKANCSTVIAPFPGIQEPTLRTL